MPEATAPASTDPSVLRPGIALKGIAASKSSSNLGLGSSDAPRANSESGEADRHFRAGWQFAIAKPTDQDLDETATRFRQAAELGDEPAQFCLAEMLFHGLGAKKDYEQAWHWHRERLFKVIL